MPQEGVGRSQMGTPRLGGMGTLPARVLSTANRWMRSVMALFHRTRTVCPGCATRVGPGVVAEASSSPKAYTYIGGRSRWNFCTGAEAGKVGGDGEWDRSETAHEVGVLIAVEVEAGKGQLGWWA